MSDADSVLCFSGSKVSPSSIPVLIIIESTSVRVVHAPYVPSTMHIAIIRTRHARQDDSVLDVQCRLNPMIKLTFAQFESESKMQQSLTLTQSASGTFQHHLPVPCPTTPACLVPRKLKIPRMGSPSKPKRLLG